MNNKEEVLKKVVAFRRKWKSQKLSLKKPDDVNQLGNTERYNNVKKRLKDLSKILYSLYEIYKADPELYGEEFLAFVGDKVIRRWPWKDIEFSSKEAQNPLTKKTYEHWTPISFFRDMFQLQNITTEHFYYALLHYYRVVSISKDEDKKLRTLKYKTTRPVTAYSDAAIQIHEKD